MNSSKLFCLSTCFLMIFGQQIMAQFGGAGYYPYNYGGIGSFFGRPNVYPTYGYYPQYPMYGSYPCFTSIYCGGGYGFGYNGFPYHQNGFNAAFAGSSSSSSGGFSTSFGVNGGFFG